MSSNSKIGLFFITMVLVITLGSCNKKNDVIPDTYVNFTLDLNDPEFVSLNGIGGSVVVGSSINNWGPGVQAMAGMALLSALV